MLPYPTDPDFPQALKARRELRGMSRADLARAAEIHEVMPRRYEEPDCGAFVRPRPHSTWLALNRALGYDIPENIDEFIDTRESVRKHGLLGSPPEEAVNNWEPEVTTKGVSTDEILLKDASLEDIVGWLHSKNIEPILRHPLKADQFN